MNKRIPSMETEDHAAQLASLLALIYGNGFDNFESMGRRDRDNILWLASDLASAIDRDINGRRAMKPVSP